MQLIDLELALKKQQSEINRLKNIIEQLCALSNIVIDDSMGEMPVMCAKN